MIICFNNIIIYNVNPKNMGTTGTRINIGDQYGYSVSLSDNGYRVAIGAPATVGGVGDGLVRIYEYINGFWIQLGEDISGIMGNEKNYGFLCITVQ